MTDELTKWIGLGLQTIALAIATFGGVKVYQELRVIVRKRPLLYALVRPRLGEASAELVNVTGKAIIITEAAFRYLVMSGAEGLTPAFNSFERGDQLPRKLDDGASINLIPSMNAGDVMEVNVNCILGDTLFQWSATLTGQQAVRNTYIDVSKVNLTKVHQLENT